jgi:hypothetical protein
MKPLKFILESFLRLLKNARETPVNQEVVSVSDREEQSILPAERRDRLLNPSKYLGK